MKGWDLQDGLLVCGFCCLEGGVAAIYWPAALILAGLLCFGFAYSIEKLKAKETAPRGTSQS